MVSRKAKNKTVIQTVSVVIFMGAMAWASVPFYDWFCRVTGFGGITQVAESGSDTVLSETMKVRFDASLERNMPCLLYTSPSPRDPKTSRMPSSA